MLQYFSRKDVTINFDSNDEVYYSVSAPIYEENGFESFDSVTVSSSRGKTGFIKAENNEIILPAKNDAAVFYTVFAYAKDISGNCSDIISYSTMLDSVFSLILSKLQK